MDDLRAVFLGFNEKDSIGANWPHLRQGDVISIRKYTNNPHFQYIFKEGEKNPFLLREDEIKLIKEDPRQQLEDFL